VQLVTLTTHRNQWACRASTVPACDFPSFACAWRRVAIPLKLMADCTQAQAETHTHTHTHTHTRTHARISTYVNFVAPCSRHSVDGSAKWGSPGRCVHTALFLLLPDPCVLQQSLRVWSVPRTAMSPNVALSVYMCFPHQVCMCVHMAVSS